VYLERIAFILTVELDFYISLYFCIYAYLL